MPVFDKFPKIKKVTIKPSLTLDNTFLSILGSLWVFSRRFSNVYFLH